MDGHLCKMQNFQKSFDFQGSSALEWSVYILPKVVLFQLGGSGHPQEEAMPIFWN